MARGSLLQGAKKSPPPRLILMAAIVLLANALRWLYTWFSAAIWSDVKLSAHGLAPHDGYPAGNFEKTWMAMMLAAGATPAPTIPVVPPATVPATWVP